MKNVFHETCQPLKLKPTRKICLKKLTSDASRVKNNFNELILDLSLIENKRKQACKRNWFHHLAISN